MDDAHEPLSNVSPTTVCSVEIRKTDDGSLVDRLDVNGNLGAPPISEINSLAWSSENIIAVSARLEPRETGFAVLYWDGSSKRGLGAITVHDSPGKILFSPDGRRLHTSFGDLPVPTRSSDAGRKHVMMEGSRCLRIDDRWVICGEHKLMQLPLEYTEADAAHPQVVVGDTIALTHRSGRLVFIKIDVDKIDQF